MHFDKSLYDKNDKIRIKYIETEPPGHISMPKGDEKSFCRKERAAFQKP